ncbi:nitrogen regulatory protein P-II [Alkaliphilus metalliredigens QYMF]|uniref:Nitrogen regulatory protein P-II n=1 Tax=Alkaliphilus metalliredigens (strain QYMF) TaxID=293826 RepID=A6TTY1_ALKMQ|nr:P-II family nitrogen regulator [Alkaliphilus metalliredigens]ABR49649.1 nitrogen regulatory protein P-II [Alkaliphilus metalliredigens QYMF]
MKEIMAIIRMNMVNKTKKALATEGFPAFTCTKISGRGKKAMDYTIEEAFLTENNMPTSVAETFSEGYRLLPKRLLLVTVPDGAVEKAVTVIIHANQTGSPGDGKIFVLPVEEAIRVRTGETGDTAIT